MLCGLYSRMMIHKPADKKAWLAGWLEAAVEGVPEFLLGGGEIGSTLIGAVARKYQALNLIMQSRKRQYDGIFKCVCVCVICCQSARVLARPW